MQRANFLTITFLGIAIIANSQGISFQQGFTWKEIQEKAKNETKYIFIDVYATWCGPCKFMDENIYPQKEVGDFFNNKFISVKLQMDTGKLDNEDVRQWYATAKELGLQYKITGFPTYIFLSPNSELLHRAVGGRFEGKYLIEEAKNALDPDKQYYTLLHQYENGKRDPEFIREFAILADQSGEMETAVSIAKQYINGLNEKELYTAQNLEFIAKYTASSKDRGFELFRKHGKKINSIIGNNRSETVLRRIIGKEELNPYILNHPDWDAIEKKVSVKYGTIGLEKVHGERMIYYMEKEEWASFGKYYALYYKKAMTRSEYHINNISWSLFKHVTDPAVLETAIETMKCNLENFDQKNYQAYDTYANLLHKVGRTAEAIKWEEKAVKFEEEGAHRENRNPDPVFRETLEKMLKGHPTWGTN